MRPYFIFYMKQLARARGGASVISDFGLLVAPGFFEFPFVVYYRAPVETLAYAQSPVMMALSDIKGLNSIRKTTLRGLQQYFDPPIAIAHDGVMNRPNLNPRAVNYNAIDANGRMRIQPIITQQRPDFAQEIIDAERKGVNDSLYVTLFQILLQNPSMTATEAMIRANEKGEPPHPSYFPTTRSARRHSWRESVNRRSLPAGGLNCSSFQSSSVQPSRCLIVA